MESTENEHSIQNIIDRLWVQRSKGHILDGPGSLTRPGIHINLPIIVAREGYLGKFHPMFLFFMSFVNTIVKFNKDGYGEYHIKRYLMSSTLL